MDFQVPTDEVSSSSKIRLLCRAVVGHTLRNQLKGLQATKGVWTFKRRHHASKW